MGSTSEHCAFVLLAEFDIYRGAQLTYQFPQPLGTDEGLLANLMLPDGAERQLEDWTIFFLNQTPSNMISPVLALESSSPSSTDGGNAPGDGSSKGEESELLYVLNLVRTKHDKSVKRGAIVKAMAICTRHPFIQIFKPVLLMALDDYFSDPSQEWLARLFDAVNAMDIAHAPALSRDEKLVMRVSERKDVFAEKFIPHPSLNGSYTGPGAGSKRPSQENTANGSSTSFDGARSRADSSASRDNASEASSSLQGSSGVVGNMGSASGSGTWPGEDGALESDGGGGGAHGQNRGRRSVDTTSVSSHGMHSNGREASIPAILDPYSRGPKDTHFYSTSIVYRGHTLPIKMPLSTFPEEVGDYSLISLIQTFSSTNTVISGPQHPHLHTNGSLTPPIILLFNALITNKRIIFLGYQRPAGQVSSFVLAACALGSGCGAVLRGFVARAFPYANLTNWEEWQQVPGYIAGVTNPLFETTGKWDLLCDIGNGRMVVNKDIYTTWPVSGSPLPPGSMLVRTGTIRGEPPNLNEEEVTGRPSLQTLGPKSEFSGKNDSADVVFMDDIVSAISYHFGESLVRARFTEYVFRFVRLVARYEEDVYGQTKIGYATTNFSQTADGYRQLGSGIIFPDDTSAAKELAVNANRMEGWRKTKMYEYYVSDFQNMLATKPIQGFDVYHQIVRMKTSKDMLEQEVELIMRSLVENVQNYEQAVELLALLPQYLGGLLPLSFGLFHQSEHIRMLTVELLSVLRAFPIGVQFLQGLNHFHRYAYVRQAHLRETKAVRGIDANLLSPPMSNMPSRTPSNRSEASLPGSTF